MGGGGGGGSRNRPISELQQIASESLISERDEGGINSFLSDLLRELNDRNVEEVRGRLDEIKEVLVGALEGAEELLFGGSVAKHTYVDGLSDVDALLLISERIAGNQNPAEIRELVAQALRSGLGSDATSIEVGTL